MSVLDAIINAVKLGLALLRARAETAILGPLTTEEVNAMLATAHTTVPEASDYQNSIVDLMKVLHLDSSLAARKALAAELGYTGALDGSAEMNVWLHAKVMEQIAQRVLVAPSG